MAHKLTITRKDKFLEESVVVKLLDDFINESYSGKRLKKNGTRISKKTVRNYEYFKNVFLDFLEYSTFEFKIYIFNNLTQSQKEKAGNYHKKFYKKFTSYLYTKKKYFDNYVGFIVKLLRSFFNYLKLERNVDTGEYHRKFFVPVEDIQIVALNSDQLRYILSDEAFNDKLKENNLILVRDVFIFGCTVALRVSDLLSLTKKNLLVQNVMA